MRFNVKVFNELEECDKIALKRTIETILGGGVSKLSFKKVDGTIRDSNATLLTDIIVESIGRPEEGVGKVTKPRKENFESVRYFDVDLKEFRTFKIENLIVLGEFDLNYFLK